MAPVMPAVTRPLRILHVVPTYYPAVRYGGPIRSVHGLCVALARRGHDVHVFTTNMDGPGDLDVPTDRPVDLDGVRVHYFPVPALRRLAWSPALGRALRAGVGGFDVVHLHSVYLWPVLAAARAAHRAGVPYVIAPRGMLVRDLIRRRSRWVKSAWISLFERRTLAEAAGLHATAQIEIEEVRRLGLAFRRAYCIQNGVAAPRVFTALDRGPFANVPRPYALFLSRISWKKGLDRLIRAWRHVPDLPLLIAGNDDEGLTAELSGLARQEQVADRVHFLGEIKDADKWALYANARMLILPSYSENFGNVVAEAMAVGCPVIVSAACGIAPLVRDSGAGIICGETPAEIAQAVGTMMRDEASRLGFGSRGRAAVDAHLSWEAVGDCMSEVYESIVAQHPRPVAPLLAT